MKWDFPVRANKRVKKAAQPVISEVQAIRVLKKRAVARRSVLKRAIKRLQSELNKIDRLLEAK